MTTESASSVLCLDARSGHLDSSELSRAVERLAAGGLIVYPTDTLYAIGCRALDPVAVESLRVAKGREETKAFPVIAGDEVQARALASVWPAAATALASRFWPGPLTLVLRAAERLPRSLLAGGATLAVRVPDAAIARELARAVGPLVSTSANLAGGSPLTTADLARSAFPLASVVVDGGSLDGAPSTIVDVSCETPSVLREGRVSALAVRDAIDEVLREPRG